MAKVTETTAKERDPRNASTYLWLAGALCMLFSFGLGRWSAASSGAETTSAAGVSTTSTYLQPHNPYLIQTAQPDNDPRELLPLPGNPGGQGQGGGEGECPIYLYQDGQLFQFAPGQPGFPGGDGDQELFPLVPPPAPRTPRPPQLDGADDVVQLPSTLVAFQIP